MSKEEKTTETNNGDSLLEARARVDTLEVDLRRQLQEAQSNDVNTLKTTEQLHPLIMTRSDRNHHRWRYAEGGEDVPDLAGDDDGLPVFKFKKDIFSFLYCYKWYQSQFIFAFLIVMGIQTVMMVLLLVSNIAFEDRTNPIQVPGNVGHAVRATQLLALLVAVFYVDDFRDGIEGIISGRPTQINGDDVVVFIERRYWNFANFCRIVSGGFILLSSWLLLVQADNVFDVLLNFLGLSFASQIDDLAFFLCENGYFGARFKVSAQKITDAEYKQESTVLNDFLQKVGLGKWTAIRNYTHSIVLFSILFGFLSGYIYLAVEQVSGAFLPNTVYVEFGDQIVPFLGIFNGCYQMSDFIDGYPSYKQIGFEADGGMFAFCNDVEGSPGWTFSAGTDRNPCINPEVISGDTITYELYDAGKENWYASSTHIPLEFLQISKVKDLREECGRGMFEKLKDACDQLEPVGALSVMSQFRSESYNKLLLDSGTKLFLDEAHAHPIYIHNHEEGNHTVFDLIVFTGRRWVLTDTDHIDELHDMSIQDLLDLKGVTEFFQKPKNIHTIAESEQHWVRLLSDIVPHATDSGTPIDLKWYEPEYNRELKYSFPSPRLIPEDIMFECKRCNNSTSKCRNDGVCSANGICQCVNGAFGGHCQDKPLGDSKCNVHFNKKSYDYDGGDCCGGTCDGIECGFDGLHSAFGKKLTVASFGFEHCNNPEMAVITLVWKRLRNHDYCNNGEEFCAIVALNLRCDDRTYFDLPELRLDVEDNCEGPFNQTVLVPYGSTCHLESSQDWYNVDYEFAMYYGLDESECLIHESNQDTTSVWFHIPTHCFSDALTDHMESFFDDSIQANAVETLSQDTISDRLCMNDQDLLVERFALKVLNFSVAIDNNNFKAHQCQGWGGSAVKIECDENHKITYLYIKDARTEGTIPTELALLSQLTHLDFFNDPMNGTIPVELSLLTKLEFLDFGGTELTGSIPTELFLLTNMKWLGLFEVPLSGVFPSEIGRMQKLTKLDIHKTGLIGTIHTEIGLLSKLRFLEIGDVNLTGTIPTEIGLLTNLRKLSLSHLDLRGPLPSEIGLLTTLKTLVLNAVGLTGTVPPELKNLSHLESWDLMLNEVAMSPTSDIPLNSTPTASPTNLKLTLVPTIAF